MAQNKTEYPKNNLSQGIKNYASTADNVLHKVDLLVPQTIRVVVSTGIHSPPTPPVVRSCALENLQHPIVAPGHKLVSCWAVRHTPNLFTRESEINKMPQGKWQPVM